MRNSTAKIQSTSASQTGLTTAAIFTSGNSQAVRLPKEFRFQTKQVTIERQGDAIILRAKPQTVGDLLRSLPALTAQEKAELDLALSDIKDQRPAETRQRFTETAPRVGAPKGKK
jgi:antitoxin VapB